MTTRTSYAAIAETLRARVQDAPLLPSSVYEPQLTERIDALRIPAAARAALHLLNDDLPRTHAIAQAEEGDATFDYLHAVVHRREGDYGNAKYWYGRVAGHPVLELVHGRDRSEALRFVDRCRRAGDRAAPELQQVQAQELAALLEYTVARPRPARPPP